MWRWLVVVVVVDVQTVTSKLSEVGGLEKSTIVLLPLETGLRCLRSRTAGQSHQSMWMGKLLRCQAGQAGWQGLADQGRPSYRKGASEVSCGE